MKDRFGHERCGGYRKEDFVLCRRCFPLLNPHDKPDPKCPRCGGYGEEPALSPYLLVQESWWRRRVVRPARRLFRWLVEPLKP